MKDRLLSVEEVGRLKESDKKYYVESTNKFVKDGVYGMSGDKEYLADGEDHKFYTRCQDVRDGNIIVFEYEEEIVIKEYKGWEILKMIDEGELKEGRKLLGDSGMSYVVKQQDPGKSLVLGYESGNDYPKSPALQTRTFTLVQKPVPFMEAAQAFSEGKNLKCEYLSSLNREPKTILFKQGDKIKNGIMSSESFGTNALAFYIVSEGKWFIL